MKALIAGHEVELVNCTVILLGDSTVDVLEQEGRFLEAVIEKGKMPLAIQRSYGKFRPKASGRVLEIVDCNLSYVAKSLERN